jgi:hypothetical protein
MSRQRIYTFDGVVDAIGGNKAVASLLGVTQAMVTYWRRAGRFPARSMPRIEAELARKNRTAVRDLWDFDPPRNYDDDPERAKSA